MPLLEADAKAIEWRCAAWLSQDPVMLDEVVKGIDPHTTNAIRFFGGEQFRSATKVFNFGYIYGRSVYGYMKDRNMPKFSEKRWKEILAAFEEKYAGLKSWHDRNIVTVNRQGYLISPTGRILKFKLVQRWDGTFGYHPPHIKNYPVQSFATADLTPLWMVQVMKQIRKYKIKALPLIPVHDSVLFDLPSESVRPVAEICFKTMEKMPKTLVEFFPSILEQYPMGVNIPLAAEVKIGPTWGEMEEYKL